MSKTILFLCTGDICRGPMAAAYTNKLLEDAGIKEFEARSAGVLTVNGLLATQETLQMLKGADVELERHRSTPLTVELLRKADLILGMTPLHVQQALREAPDVRGKVFLLKEYAHSDMKKAHIDDPMGNTLEVYKKVFNEICAACQKLVKLPDISGKEDKGGKKKSSRKPAKRARKKSASKKSASKKSAKKKAASGGARKSTGGKSAKKKTPAKKTSAGKTKKSRSKRKATKSSSRKSAGKKPARSAKAKQSGRKSKTC